MKPMANWILALSLAFCAGLVQARAGVPIIDFIGQTALRADRSPLDAPAIKKAFHTVGARQGWSIIEEAPDRLVGTLLVRGKHTAVVEITLRQGGFDLKYRSSINLHARETPLEAGASEPAPPAGAKLASGGVWTIHPNYNRWVGNLVAGARAELGI